MDDFAQQFQSPQPSPQAQTQESQYDTSYPRKRSPKKFLYLLAGVLIVLVLFNIVRTLSSSKSPQPSPAPTPSVESVIEENVPSELQETPTPQPTATPKASPDPVDKTTGLDRSKLSVSVQNGSGALGVAKKAADFLKGLGYTISSTGNADNFNYTNVTVKVKNSQKDFLPLLVKDLNASYLVAASSSDLSATASADALVIIGK